MTENEVWEFISSTLAQDWCKVQPCERYPDGLLIEAFRIDGAWLEVARHPSRQYEIIDWRISGLPLFTGWC